MIELIMEVTKCRADLTKKEQMDKFIVFWAARFVEHLDEIGPWVLQRYGIELSAAGKRRLQSMVKGWRSAAESTGRLTIIDEFFDDTIFFKRVAQDKLRRKGVPCFPDLLEHMMEEVQYAKNIQSGTMSREQERLYWLEQHQPEVLSFTACVVPQLLQEEGVEVSAALRALLAEGEAVKRHLLAEGADLALVLQKQQRTTEQIKRHLQAAQVLPDTRDMLNYLIEHEDRELAFTVHRLSQLSR
jgi:hypothetical protein